MNEFHVDRVLTQMLKNVRTEIMVLFSMFQITFKVRVSTNNFEGSIALILSKSSCIL